MASVDTREYERLVEAREGFQQRGLVSTFESEEELSRKVSADITRTIREHFAPSLESEPAERTDLSASPRAVLVARIVRGGRNERLTLQNVGSAAAENVTFEVVVPEGESEPFIGKDDVAIGLLPPHASIDYPMAETFGTAAHWDIVMRWTEGAFEYETRQTMR